MVAKDHFHKEEVAERKAAMADNRRTGNYRSDPWREPETRAERPANCYGCTWERVSANEVRLKFAHKMCHPAHLPE